MVLIFWCGLGAAAGALAGRFVNNTLEGLVAGFLLGPVIGPAIILLNAHEERTELAERERQAALRAL
jgi:uncharacterized membrane protein